MPQWEALLADLIEHLGAAGSPIPSLIDAGCSEAQVREFAAAAAFYQAGLWDYLDDIDLIKIETPKAPPHVEANILLAESTRHAERRIELFCNAKEIAMAQLGSMMGEEVGHFWGITETRPFMRATHGLADALHDAGQTREAIAQYQELLRLNPNDNQGVRDQLTPLLLVSNREVEAVELLDRYREPTAVALHEIARRVPTRRPLRRCEEGNPSCLPHQ